MDTPVIAVVGSRQSGKTTTTEALIKGLTKKGYRVAAAKHIPEVDFTIDTKNKDTWKQAQAGAKTILTVAPNELAIIKKVSTAKYDLNDITANLEENEVDLVILEGFRKLVAKNLTVPKIVTAKTAEEIQDAMQYFKPILAFSTPQQLTVKELKIPKIDAVKEPEKLVEAVDRRVSPIIRKKRTQKAGLKIQVNHKNVPLNPFVQNFVRNVVFSMLSTLKQTMLIGDENILIEIKKADKK